jgi:hypothetical protein
MPHSDPDSLDNHVTDMDAPSGRAGDSVSLGDQSTANDVRSPGSDFVPTDGGLDDLGHRPF